MSADSLVVLVVVIATGALGAAGVLLRMAMERHRLVERYDHIKAMLVYQEQLRAKRQKARNSVARPATYQSGGDGAVTVVQAGGEVGAGG
ncbi:MAG: hypothetical protein ACOC7R_03690 [Planctomycetota bacterium]